MKNAWEHSLWIVNSGRQILESENKIKMFTLYIVPYENFYKALLC